MRSRVNRLIGIVLAGGIVVLLGVMQPVAAQSGDKDPTPGQTTIHVVQRDETLYRIALQYDTTVDAIAEANGISDTGYIVEGQRLLIPNAQASVPGTATLYTVRPGDSLQTVSYTYRTSIESLAAANYITNPAQLYIGQELNIPYEKNNPASSVPQAVHRVQSGENLFQIALRYNVPLSALTRANDLRSSLPVYPGLRVWVPGGDSTAALGDLPYPFTGCTLNPIPAMQGMTISIHLSTAGPAALSGTFVGYPVQFATQDANQHYALFGVHTFAASGVFPMQLVAAQPDGTQTPLTLRIRIEEGGYGAEAISVTTEMQDLLTLDVTEPEWVRTATMMSGFTAQRYFDGVMLVPSDGVVTSAFGTRRMYNGGVLSTFHSGVDLGGAPGSDIVAPAAGVVVLASTLPVRGNATIIDHGWGVFSGFWHQDQMYVKVGDVVAPGQVIGTVGSTGRSTGPHLHWEMWVGGVQVDPLQWVQQSFP